MKNILIFSLVPIGVIFMSLFLPYESHDDYTSGSFLSTSTLIASGIKTYGVNYLPAYIPVLFIAICLAIIKFNENLATAIISLILSFCNLFYMGFLGFLLVFYLNFFGGPRNYELEFGFFLALVAVIVYIPIMIIHLIMVVRKRKKGHKSESAIKSTDLLDDLLES